MNNKKSESILINLDIGDQLTTISCGHIVVELIKFIAYQRLQIPYTYQWLKQIVNLKKDREERAEIDKKETFQSERHYRTASTSLESLDFVLKSLRQEISGPAMPEEICITLGPSPVTCKEVYRLLLPSVCHRPQCHSSKIAKDQKIQGNVFQKLVTSEVLSQVFSNAIPPTNMHVFIRKKVTKENILGEDNFVPASGSRLPKSSRIVVVDFRNKSDDDVACCNDFQIFGDMSSSTNGEAYNLSDDDLSEIQSTDSVKWYQSTYVMKGFKDCIVNGNSVTNSWLK